MARRRKRRKRRRNQGNVKAPGQRYITAPVGGRRRRRNNPGLKGMMSRARLIEAGKLGAGALVGMLAVSRITALTKVSGPLKYLAQFGIGVVGGSLIPDKAISSGVMASAVASSIKGFAESRGVKIFSGVDEIDEADLIALKEAVDVRGQEYLGEAYAGEAEEDVEEMDVLGEAYAGETDYLGQDEDLEEMEEIDLDL